MFALPPVNSAYGVEGSSDDNPIQLEGVTEDEFKALLWVMFRSGYGSSRTLTQPQWVSVLRLSTMWFFKDIRTRAISELSKLVSTPAARIVLARTYNISGWTEPALCALAQQDAPLSAQDLEALGWDAAAKLVQIRESVVFRVVCVRVQLLHRRARPHRYSRAGRRGRWDGGARPRAGGAAVGGSEGGSGWRRSSRRVRGRGR
ncbi:hypothetical protein GSI_04775 [Ganoderma sinense ZZ0214-1]|uniref:BTB domain-containing protein n=1 Tax=Ganoderma sinense ZZ0214-1 TaxID=1077348 RepID=A0A2G8SHR8_9APHY|nr:hypothetical protein GSI_04775 [Ganoderma sinense ZZ0214-1]